MRPFLQEFPHRRKQNRMLTPNDCLAAQQPSGRKWCGALEDALHRIGDRRVLTAPGFIGANRAA